MRPSPGQQPAPWANLPAVLYQAFRICRNILWRNPFIYEDYYRLRYGRYLGVKSADIIVEGYPRSSNTFIVEALKVARPDLKVVSHLHCPVVALQAVRWRRPCYILVRHPIDAASSWAVFHKCSSPVRALHSYIDFHRALIPIIDDLRIVTFEHSTSNTLAVVKHMLRSVAGTGDALINGDDIERIAMKRVLSRYKEIDVRIHPLPSEERYELLESARAILVQSNNGRELRMALELYCVFVGRAIAVLD